MKNSTKSLSILSGANILSQPAKTYFFFLLLSAVLSFLYLEIVLPGHVHFPLASDSYQYLKSYDSNFQSSGRWLNFLTFDLISALPKRLAYYLDLLTTAILWLCFLKPKRTVHHILLFSVLLLVILSSNILFSVRLWPGGRIMTNLAAIMAVLVIRSDLRLALKVPLILMAVLAIGGGYQFHHMFLILAFISPAKDITYNLKSFALITGLWAIGFVISYYFADILTHLNFGDGRNEIAGYRQSQIKGEGHVETVLLNAQFIIRSMIGRLFVQLPVPAISIFGLAIILIGGVIGIRHMPIPKDVIYRLLWWVAPIFAIIAVLALANHAYYQRLNLSSLMVFVIGLWIIARESDLAMKAIILGCLCLIIPQTASNFIGVRAIERDTTKTLNLIGPLLDKYQIGDEARIVMYDFDKTVTKQEARIRWSETYIRRILEINRFVYCVKKERRLCPRLGARKKTIITNRACQASDHIYSELRGRQITVYILNQKICETRKESKLR